ncbi:MAG: metallophosphoesterase [Magnetococcales bacterium]|nr:metallophosphoesterase [Magnetococcales bacterium]
MKIGLISDTHDHLQHIRLAAGIFKERGVDLVIHAGDFCSPPAALALEGLPVAAVFGNNDGEKLGMAKMFQRIEGRLEGDFLEVESEAGPVAVYHGTVAAILESLIQCGKYRAVVSGHTHKPVNEQVGKTLVLNPGSAHGFGGAATVMVVDLVSGAAELIEL